MKKTLIIITALLTVAVSVGIVFAVESVNPDYSAIINGNTTDIDALNFEKGTPAEKHIKEVIADHALTENDVDLYNNYFTDEIKQLSYDEALAKYTELSNRMKELSFDDPLMPALVEQHSMYKSYLDTMATGKNYLLDKYNNCKDIIFGRIYLTEQAIEAYGETEENTALLNLYNALDRMLDSIDINAPDADRNLILYQLGCIKGANKATLSNSLSISKMYEITNGYNAGNSIEALLKDYYVTA